MSCILYSELYRLNIELTHISNSALFAVTAVRAIRSSVQAHMRTNPKAQAQEPAQPAQPAPEASGAMESV